MPDTVRNSTDFERLMTGACRQKQIHPELIDEVSSQYKNVTATCSNKGQQAETESTQCKNYLGYWVDHSLHLESKVRDAQTETRSCWCPYRVLKQKNNVCEKDKGDTFDYLHGWAMAE